MLRDLWSQDKISSLLNTGTTEVMFFCRLYVPAIRTGNNLSKTMEAARQCRADGIAQPERFRKNGTGTDQGLCGGVVWKTALKIRKAMVLEWGFCKKWINVKSKNACLFYIVCNGSYLNKDE
jgi:hypothetical protein